MFLNRGEIGEGALAQRAVKVHAGEAEGASKAVADAVLAHLQLHREMTLIWDDGLNT